MLEPIESVKIVGISRDAIRDVVLETMRIYGSMDPEEEWGDDDEEIEIKRVSYDPDRRAFDFDVCSTESMIEDPEPRSATRQALLGAIQNSDSVEIDSEIPDEITIIGAGYDRSRELAYIEIMSDDFDPIMEAEEAPKIEVEVAEEGESDG